MKNATLSPEPDVTNLFETIHEIGPLLNAKVDEEEANRRISESSLNALREAGLLRLFLPKSLGGIEAEPLTVAKAVEAVSLHNATAGWTMMVANVSSWWCARLSAQGVEEVYADGADTFMAGAFHPPMKATPVKGGYRINGRSPLTSNVHEARWTFVTAFVMNGDQIRTSIWIRGSPAAYGRSGRPPGRSRCGARGIATRRQHARTGRNCARR